MPKLKTFVIGVDPGFSGGMAVLDADKECFMLAKMPGSAEGIYDWFTQWRSMSIHCYIEQVTGFHAKDRGRANMGPSMFNFGKNFGWLQLAAIAGLDRPAEYVVPVTWQKFNGVERMKSETPSQWKSRLRLVASHFLSLQRTEPPAGVTLETADAYLIALYGWSKVYG